MRTNLKVGLAAAAAVVALAGGSTVALAAATGGLGNGGLPAGYGPLAGRGGSASSCTAPSLPGQSVDITVSDMGGGYGGMMGGRGQGGMMGGASGTANGGAWGAMMRGTMSVQASPTSVTAGTVSLKVANNGSLTHELVVLPLAEGAQPGQRPIASDGRVGEDGSLGEASNTCAADDGDGIAAGSYGWTTLTLEPGRYEIVCNLPGHYAAGMYAELDVTA